MAGEQQLHTAPNPAPKIGKTLDISYDKEKTLIRTIAELGHGEEVREGSTVLLHLEVLQPDDSGGLECIYASKRTHPGGLRVVVGSSLHSEALERSVLSCKPGAVIDTLCTCPDIAYDATLGIKARQIPEGAEEFWLSADGPIGCAQNAKAPKPYMARQNEIPPPWVPSTYAMLHHIEVQDVTPGVIPMHMDSGERLEWVRQRKAWGVQLYQDGMYGRAMRTFRKAMLDLEVPCDWSCNEQHNVERNQLRTQLHLNTAAAGVKLPTTKPYPDLSPPKFHYDPHLDVIFHCTKVLDVDTQNVKALYRRSVAHLDLPPERHINGLALAQDDLKRALELDPENEDVLQQWKRAKEIQKQIDREAAPMFSKMIAGAE